MKRFVLLNIFLFTIFLKVWGAEIDEEEIKKVGKVEFENYRGIFESVGIDYLRTMGEYLAKISDVGRKKQYFLYEIVVVQPKEDLLGADVFFILKESRIKHINAIRHILAGYLTERYKYNPKEAFTLAVFITYYNAVYRGNVEYFRSKYVPELFSFTTKNIGISTKYYEWAGNTEIVIPTKIGLTKEKITLGEISKKEVIQEIKEKEEDFGVKERKEMIEIRKKELEEEKQKLTEKEEELQRKKEELQERKSEIEEVEKQLEQKLQETTNEKDREEIKQQMEELSKEKEKIEKEEEKLKEEESKINQFRKEIEKEEKEIKEEEKEIKKDEEKVERKRESELVKEEEKERAKEPGDKTVFRGKMYYLKKQDFDPRGHYNNTMYLIDLSERKVVKESSFKKICGFKYYVYGDGVVVIGYKESHSQDHFLVLLDRENIEPKIIGKDNIFWRSFIEFKDDFLYAITIVNGRYYLGKFDRKLERVGISDTEVDPDTFLTFYEGQILINDRSKNIVILDEKTLKKIGEVKLK